MSGDVRMTIPLMVMSWSMSVGERIQRSHSNMQDGGVGLPSGFSILMFFVFSTLKGRTYQSGRHMHSSYDILLSYAHINVLFHEQHFTSQT